MLRAILIAALVAGFVWLIVTIVAHRQEPVYTQQPIETAAPVEPSPVPALPVPVKHRHAQHLFHGEHCPDPWIMLPGSATCEATGMQYLVDENAWSVRVK